MAYMQRAKEDHLDVNAKVSGFTGPQRFYIAFAQNYCENTRPEAVREQVLQDPQSPDQIRANGTIVNQPGFANAFGCRNRRPWSRPTVAASGSGVPVSPGAPFIAA